MSRKPSFLRALPLLLLLVTGIVQAQSVYSCPMMDKVLYGECCCAGHNTNEFCIDTDSDDAAYAGTDQCCERTVELSFDVDSQQDALILKSAEIRSDVDPPAPMIVAMWASIPQVSQARILVPDSFQKVRHSGADIYLTTQRLRI